MPTTTTHAAASATSNGAFPACTTAVPGKYGQVPLDACNSSYNAIPEFIPAVVVSVIFGTLTLIHIIEAVVYKKVSSVGCSFLNTMILTLIAGIHLGPDHGRRLGDNSVYSTRSWRA